MSRRRLPGRLCPSEGSCRDDQGLVALAVALAVSALLFLTGLLAFQMAGNNQSEASLRRIQAMALDAAEGGLDRAYQSIQSAPTANQLPCGPAVLTENLSTKPARSSYSVSISYYSTFPVTTSALSCPSAGGDLSSAQAASVVATGTTGAGTALAASQYMEALVKITPGSTTGSVFDQAVFSNQSMSGSNNPTIYGHNGNDGNLYTNGSVSCGNGFLVQGNVVAAGGFTGTNNCTVEGNVTTVGNISLANNTAVGGTATSTGNSGCASPSTQGNITMTNNASVAQSAYAYCSITVSGSATVGHSIVPNDSALTSQGVQTTESLPSVPWPDTAALKADWSSAGYTNQLLNDDNCSAGGVYQDIANMATATAPTLITTTCALSWSGHSSISLNQNLAIFSTGGFSMANNTSWQSASSTVHQLFLLVPSVVDETQTTCTSGQPGITFSNNTSFAATLDVLDYTPCTLVIANNSTGYGQVYAGTLDANNLFSAHFVPMSLPGGAASGGGQSASFTLLAVVYERQLSSPAAS